MKIVCEYCNSSSLEEQKCYNEESYFITILRCKYCGGCKEVKERFIDCSNASFINIKEVKK